ncbi:MAG: hypothetical protein IKM36_03530 [Oscillospiraceae bacterium]|nr:hypothetical protein [Oscillospiraceae bacterium]
MQAIEGFTPGASAENPNYRNVAGEIEARDAAGRRNLTAEQRKTAAPNLGDEDTVLAGDENPFSYLRDSETLSIKEQINERADELNAMDPVAKVKVPENMKNKREAAKWAIQLLAHTGYRVDRFGYGEIYFDKSDIDKGMRYADTPAEKAAIAALPQVLKRGIEIGTHRDHKGRKKQTVTFSAPVELNGVRGNMAVVINKNGNHYYAHRIILPNGGNFAFSDANQKDTTRELYQGVTVSGSLADTTSVVPMRSISATDRKSNPQNAIGRNFQELSDDVFEELTRSEPPEAEDRSVMERLRQKDLDEYWEEVERLADAVADEDDANMDPNPDPEDLVQTDVQREKVPLREKVEDVRSFIARKFFDAGDAVTQIQKQTGDRHLYSYFNQARASANAAVQMIEGNRFDTLGRNTGDGLNKVLETVRSKGAEYYKDFQLYLLHMHNIDRMQRENPERVDAARASFERFKAENPDLAQFADYQISRMAAEETSPYYFVAGEYMRYLQAMQRAEISASSPDRGAA